MVLKLSFENDLEQRFRESAMRKYGFSKGAITKASREAIKLWLKTSISQKNKEEIGDPFEAVEGILSNLKGKKTSVQLQHEAKDLWARSS